MHLYWLFQSFQSSKFGLSYSPFHFFPSPALGLVVEFLLLFTVLLTDDAAVLDAVPAGFEGEVSLLAEVAPVVTGWLRVLTFLLLDFVVGDNVRLLAGKDAFGDTELFFWSITVFFPDAPFCDWFDVSSFLSILLKSR